MFFDLRTEESAKRFIQSLLETSKEEPIYDALFNSNSDLEPSYEDIVGTLPTKDIDLANISLLGTHVLGSLDKCREISKRGLMGLRQVLAGKTILASALKRYGIVIDPHKKTLRFENSLYDLDYNHVGYAHTSYGDNPALQHIAYRICRDSGLTAFLYSPSFETYGTDIHKRPEILKDLAEFLPEARKLERLWSHYSKPYKVVFWASLNQVDAATFNETNLKVESLSQPQKDRIIRWMTNNALLRSQNRLQESYLYIKPEVTIPNSQLISIDSL